MERGLHACVSELIRTSWRVSPDEHLSVGQLVRLGGSARSRVWRVTAARDGGARSRTFIVKSPEETDGQHTDRAGRLGNEWAALTFIDARLGPRNARVVAPQLCGADLGPVGVLLLEDLSPLRGGLEALLLGSIRVQGGAAVSVTKLATVLAHMHGRCAAHCDEFAAIRARSGLACKGAPDVSSVAALVETANALLGHALEGPDAEGFQREMGHSFQSSFTTEGPFSTLIHGDLCPTNTAVLNKAGDVALLDFEFARIGNAVMDACVFRLGFPTSHYVGRLPRDLVRAAERLYRAEAAAAGLPAAADRVLWRRAMGECCALWTWGFLRASVARGVLKEDGAMGLRVRCSRRQAVLWRLRVCAKAAGKHCDMAAVASVCQRTLHALEARWGALDKTQPESMAFAGAP